MKTRKYIYIIVSFLLLLCSCKEKDKKQDINLGISFGCYCDFRNAKYPLQLGNFVRLCNRNEIQTEGGPANYSYWLPIDTFLDNVKVEDAGMDDVVDEFDFNIIESDSVIYIEGAVIDGEEIVDVADSAESHEEDIIDVNSVKKVESHYYDTCKNVFVICAENLDICTITDTFRSNVLSRRVSVQGFNTILVSESFIFDGNSVPLRGRKFNLDSYVQEAKEDHYETNKLEIDGKEYQVYSQFSGVFFPPSTIERIQNHLESLGGNPKYVSSCCDVEGNKIDCQFVFDNGASITFVSAPYLFTNASIVSAKGTNSEISMRLLMHGFNVSSLRDIHSFAFYNKVSGEDVLYKADIDPSKKKYRDEVQSKARTKDDVSEIGDTYWDIVKYIARNMWPYLLLLLPFVLKRRHRAIPVMDFYKNKTKDYVKRVGVLYFKEGNWQLILRKKITFFTFDMAEKFGIDISSENPADIEANANVLARSTKLDERKMVNLIKMLNNYRYGDKRQLVNENIFNSVCADINEVQLSLLNNKERNKKN